MREAELPKLGFGAANIGNLHRELSDQQSWEILETAWKLGIRHYDTAPHYGLGLSERRLGEFLATKPRDEYLLSTKVGRLLRPNPQYRGEKDTENSFFVPSDLVRVWDFSASGIRASLAESLQRLGIDRVDILYLHDPELHGIGHALESALPALTAIRNEALVGAIGVGSMNTDALTATVNGGKLDLVMLAGRYTLLEQPTAANVLPACVKHDTDIVAASVFNSGLLADTTPSRSGRYQYGELPEQLWHKLTQIAAICANHQVPLPAAAIQFPLRNAQVRSVVVGASRPEQLADSVAYAALPIPVQMWQELTEAQLIPK